MIINANAKNYWYATWCKVCVNERRRDKYRTQRESMPPSEKYIEQASPYSPCSVCIFERECRADVDYNYNPWCSPASLWHRVYLEQYPEAHQRSIWKIEERIKA